MKEKGITSFATTFSGITGFVVGGGGIPFPITLEDLIDSTVEETNPEFSKVLVDSEEKILWGLRKDGTEYTPDLTGCTITIVTDAAPIVGYVKNFI